MMMMITILYYTFSHFKNDNDSNHDSDSDNDSESDNDSDNDSESYNDSDSDNIKNEGIFAFETSGRMAIVLVTFTSSKLARFGQE